MQKKLGIFNFRPFWKVTVVIATDETLKVILCIALGADHMGIFSPGWTFSLVDQAESSSQASYKILVKRSLRLHEENFSPVWATRDEIFSPVDRAEIPHVIDKKFQPGLKIHKRMRRTLVYNNKYKKQRFPPSHSVSGRPEISHVIAFFFPARSVSARAEILHVISPLVSFFSEIFMGTIWTLNFPF